MPQNTSQKYDRNHKIAQLYKENRKHTVRSLALQFNLSPERISQIIEAETGCTEKQLTKIQIMGSKWISDKDKELGDMIRRLQINMLGRREASTLITLLEDENFEVAKKMIDQKLVNDVADAAEWRN